MHKTNAPARVAAAVALFGMASVACSTAQQPAPATSEPAGAIASATAPATPGPSSLPVATAADLDVTWDDAATVFEPLVITAGHEVEHHESVRDAVRSATAVVVGTPVRIGPTRSIMAPGEEDSPVRYSGYWLKVNELLAGTLPVSDEDGTILVEFLGEVADARIDQGRPAVWFLRHKGEGWPKGSSGDVFEGDQVAYRIVSTAGVFVQGEEKVVNPVRESMRGQLTDDGSAPSRDPFVAEAETHERLSDLVESVRREARRDQP